MAWVKIDDQAPRHHKMLKAGPAACWLWVCGLAHSQSQLTDGFISYDVLPMIGVTKHAPKLATQLVLAKLWDVVEGGYIIHDYLTFNDSKDEMLLRRAHMAGIRAAAGEKGGRVSSAVRQAKMLQAQAEARRRLLQANDEANAKQVASSPGSKIEANGEANLAKQPPSKSSIAPDPTRPDPFVSAKQTCDARATPKWQKTPIIGRNTHYSHPFCDDTYSYCVAAQVHETLADLLAPKYQGDRDAAKAALLVWYPTVCASLPAAFVMGDGFKFWRGRFEAAFASTDVPTHDDTADRAAQHARVLKAIHDADAAKTVGPRR
jgi:hypothetical protein